MLDDVVCGRFCFGLCYRVAPPATVFIFLDGGDLEENDVDNETSQTEDFVRFYVLFLFLQSAPFTFQSI